MNDMHVADGVFLSLANIVQRIQLGGQYPTTVLEQLVPLVKNALQPWQ